MAVKKSVRKKTAAGKAGRTAATRKGARSTAVKKKATRRKASPKPKPAGRKVVSKNVVSKKTVVAKPRTAGRLTTAAARKTAALGRPRVPGTAELELMFQKDLEARQVFAFLRVKTLKELEELSPDEILERLTAPMVRTVGRIRKALAMNNRCLAGDQKFAVAFKKQLP